MLSVFGFLRRIFFSWRRVDFCSLISFYFQAWSCSRSTNLEIHVMFAYMIHLKSIFSKAASSNSILLIVRSFAHVNNNNFGRFYERARAESGSFGYIFHRAGDVFDGEAWPTSSLLQINITSSRGRPAIRQSEIKLFQSRLIPPLRYCRDRGDCPVLKSAENCGWVTRALEI